MAQSSTFGAGRHTFRIPSSATNIRVYLASGQGGQGGGDAGTVVGGSKGAGRFGRFKLPNGFAGDLFELYVGAGGGGGKDVGQTAFAGGSGGTNGTTTSAGVIPNPTGYGAAGGNDRPGGSSGGGGGGGGSTIIRNLDRGSELTRTLIWAGGGGGGGGGSNGNYNGPTQGSYNGGSAGGFTSVGDASMFSQIANGGNAVQTNGSSGGSCDSTAGGDGGGVGGGGGGYTAGIGGGCAGNDQQGGAAAANRSSGGGGGLSAYSGNAGITLESSSSYSPTSDVTTVPASDADKKGGDGYVYFTWDDVEITSFTASPNPQNSNQVTDSTPNYSTTLSWTLSVTSPTTTLTLVSDIGEQWDVSGTSSFTVTNLPQSEAGVNSPATRTYTLYVGSTTSAEFATVTVNTFNDNIPSNTWNTTFINLEENTEYTLNLGVLSGVDMPTSISIEGEGNFIGTGTSFSNSYLFYNQNNVQFKTTSLPFNTDLTGVAADAEFGKTNSKTVTITTPDGSFDVTVTTRAPKIREDFNYANSINKYPYEDIDLITNNPLEYTLSAQINADDIEIPMEIKLDDPDAEISINGGTWQNTREI